MEQMVLDTIIKEEKQSTESTQRSSKHKEKDGKEDTKTFEKSNNKKSKNDSVINFGDKYVRCLQVM